MVRNSVELYKNPVNPDLISLHMYTDREVVKGTREGIEIFQNPYNNKEITK